jgi:hypothetical protein
MKPSEPCAAAASLSPYKPSANIGVLVAAAAGKSLSLQILQLPWALITTQAKSEL